MKIPRESQNSQVFFGLVFFLAIVAIIINVLVMVVQHYF